MYDLTAMGARIRQLRNQKGLTQDSFAKELGISAQAVSKWETGAGCPDIAMLPLIANILECSIDALFSDVAAEPVKPAETVEEVSEEAEPSPVLGPDMEDDLLERELNALSEEIDQQMKEQEREAKFEEKLEEKFAEAERRFAEQEKKMDEASYHFDRESYRAAHGEDNARVHLHTEADNLKQNAAHLGDDIAHEVEKTLEGVGGDLSNLGTLISEKVNQIINRSLGLAGSRSRGRNAKAAAGSQVWQGVEIRSLYLRTSGSADITVEPGEPGQWRVEAQGSMEFIEHLRCTEDGSTLRIETAPYQQRNLGLFSPDNSIVIYTGFEDGEELDAELRGSGDMDCHVNFEVSHVGTYGSGDVELQDAGYLNVTASGSGDVSVAMGRNAVISSSGSCDVEIGCLVGVSEVKTSGSGDVHIGSAGGSLTFRGSGSGDLEVFSEALENLIIFCSGSGDVEVGIGTVQKLELTLRGSGDFNGRQLTVGDLKAVLSGASEAFIGEVTGSISHRIGTAANLTIG